MHICRNIHLRRLIETAKTLCSKDASTGILLDIDVIHGKISFKEGMPCIAYVLITSTPVFRRLMEVYQLSLTYEFFTGARHTRYDHSIGVGYLAYKTLKYILRKAENCRETNSGFECYIDALGKVRFDEKDYAIALVAGLLHDIGHANYGHAVDALARPLKLWFREMYENYMIWEGKEFWGGTTPVGFGSEAPKFDTTMVLYLLLSCDALRNTLNAFGKEIVKVWEDINFYDVEFAKLLAYIYSGESAPQYPELRLSNVAKFKISLLRKILYEEIDVDRIDYLLRDAYYLGEKNIRQNLRHLWELLKKLREEICLLSGYAGELKLYLMYRNGKAELEASRGQREQYYFIFAGIPIRQKFLEWVHDVVKEARKHMYNHFYEIPRKALLDMIIYRIVYTTFYCIFKLKPVPEEFREELLYFLTLPTLEANCIIYDSLKKNCGSYIQIATDIEKAFIKNTLEISEIMKPEIFRVIINELKTTRSNGIIKLLGRSVINISVQELLDIIYRRLDEAGTPQNHVTIRFATLPQLLDYDLGSTISLSAIESSWKDRVIIIINFYTYRDLIKTLNKASTEKNYDNVKEILEYINSKEGEKTLFYLLVSETDIEQVNNIKKDVLNNIVNRIVAGISAPS